MTFSPDEHLHNLIFGSMPQAEFMEYFEENIGHFADEVVVEAFSGVLNPLPKMGKCNITVYRGGLVTLVTSKGRWSCYETRARAEEREHISKWSEYMRGNWVKEIPIIPGIYAVRNLEQRLFFHELREVSGRLVDISGGFVPAGKVSTWCGSWWSLPLPPYPGAV